VAKTCEIRITPRRGVLDSAGEEGASFREVQVNGG